MFQWKNVQLSPEDYENYIWNEDEKQTRVNNSNITELEWSQLYDKAQIKSLQNKKIKKSVLAYESSIVRLFEQPSEGIPSKDLQKLYERQNNELRLHLAQLYEQIGLLHVRNISTTVQFTISRLLHLEKEFIKIICSQQQEIEELRSQNQRLQLIKNSHLCMSCQEDVQRTKNQMIRQQMMTCETPSHIVQKLQRLEDQQLSQPQKIERKNREAIKKQQKQDQIQRFHYLNSVDKALKNRQKILKCNSAPLENILSGHLNQILDMLQISKLPFLQRSLKEYESVNQSYESIDGMKSLIDTQNFYKKVSILLEKPYQNLIDNIQRYIKSTAQSTRAVSTSTVQTQTIHLTEVDHIKFLEKKASQLSYQLQSLKESKTKSEFDLMNNLQSLHRIDVKYMELLNRNKNTQIQNKKLDSEVKELKGQLRIIKENHKFDQNRLIELNQVEKSKFLREIKILQSKVKDHQSNKNKTIHTVQKVEKAIQTQSDCIIQQTMLCPQNQNFIKRISRQSTERKSLKHLKRSTTLRTQQRKSHQIPQTSQPETQQIGQIASFSIFKQNAEVDVRSKPLKLFTLNPQEQHNDTLIHRVSSRKLDSHKLKENQAKQKYQSSSFLKSPALSPVNQSRKIKRLPEKKFKNTHHETEYYNNKEKVESKNQQTVRAHTKNEKRQNSIEIKIMPHTYSQNQQKEDFCKEAIVQNLTQQQITYSIKINSTSSKLHNKQEEVLLTSLLEKQPDNIPVAQRQQLSKLVKFSLSNYDKLIQKNIFSLLYDMKLQNDGKATPFRNAKRATKIIEANNQIENKVDIQCTKIGIKFLQLFFNLQEAQKYQKKTGIWEQFDAFIMIDNNFSKYCQKIQSYFEKLKKEKPMLYQQSIIFLSRPIYFCDQIEGKDESTREIIIFKQSLNMFNLPKNWIKKLFEKLLKLHKIMHKNCNHIQQFLDIVGFK